MRWKNPVKKEPTVNTRTLNRFVKSGALSVAAVVVFVGTTLINAQGSLSSDVPVYGLPCVVLTAPRTFIVLLPRVVVIGHRPTKADGIDSNVAEHGTSKVFTSN